MNAVLVAVLLVVPTWLDLPPEIDMPGQATVVAVRVNPPTESVPAPSVGTTDSVGGRCVGWEALLAAESPGWSVERMSRIAYRESRCLPGARNRSSSATGLLQILASHCPWLARQMGTWCTRDRLTDPQFNVAAAAVLWDEQGYGAWVTS
jgi:hypothetical protein